MSGQGESKNEWGGQEARGCEGEHQDIHIKGRGCGRIIITEFSPKERSPLKEKSRDDRERDVSGALNEKVLEEDKGEGTCKDVEGYGRDVCGRFEEDVCERRDIGAVVEDALTAFQRGDKVNIPMEISGDSTQGYRVRFRAEERTEVGVDVGGFALRHERENAVIVTLKLSPEHPQKPQESAQRPIIPTTSSPSPSILSTSLPSSTDIVSTSPLSRPKDSTSPEDILQCPCKRICAPQAPCCHPQARGPHHDTYKPHTCAPHFDHCLPHFDYHLAPHYGHHKHHYLPHHMDKSCCGSQCCKPHYCKPHRDGCCGPHKEPEPQKEPHKKGRQ